MGKGEYSTVHHCPGAKGPVSGTGTFGYVNIPAGNCTWADYQGFKRAYCTKHQVPCVNGCQGLFQMKNKFQCKHCDERDAREAATSKKARDAERKKAEKQQKEDALWEKHALKNAKKKK
jgi:hypothetical protein